MNKQSQWLFEVPPTLEAKLQSNPYTNPEYFNPKWEDEWELQEANSYGLGEEEWEQSSSSSSGRQTIRETISGFSRYSNAIPPQERGKIARIAQMIVQSYRLRQPIRTVRLVGHADRDVQRGAGFEKKISGDRALTVQKALIVAIKDPSIVSQISWQRVSAAASRLIVKNPKTEGDRLRNRRVDIFLPDCINVRCVAVNAFPKKYAATLQRTSAVQGSFNKASFQRDNSFPIPQSSELHHNQALQKRLEEAINKHLPQTEKGKTAFTIVQLSQKRCHQWAGFLQDQVHYSASLIKIVTIYAAYELRAAANRLAKVLKPKTDKELFDALEKEFTPQITERIESILTRLGSKVDRSKVPPNHLSLKPTYKKIFQNNTTNPNQKRLTESVEFDETYNRQLTDIVQDPNSNAHATFCIHGLGYGYIIGALESAGFFNSATGEGIWLTGDYAQRWPYIRINSMNDGKVAQATTAFKMAELFTLLWDKKLFDDPAHPNSSSEMLNRLTGDFTWTGHELPLKDDTVTHSKVGHGPLKKGGGVYSEAYILKSKKQTYVVVWQNYSDNRPFEPIAKVIKETISEAAQENCSNSLSLRKTRGWS